MRATTGSPIQPSEFLVELLDGTRADAPSLNQLLDAGIADADQRVLGRDKEGIRCHEQHHNQHSQQRKRDHGEKLFYHRALLERLPSVAKQQRNSHLACNDARAGIASFRSYCYVRFSEQKPAPTFQNRANSAQLRSTSRRHPAGLHSRNGD